MHHIFVRVDWRFANNIDLVKFSTASSALSSLERRLPREMAEVQVTETETNRRGSIIMMSHS